MVEDDNEKVAAFLEWLNDFSTRENVDFTISATKDPATVPDSLKNSSNFSQIYNKEEHLINTNRRRIFFGGLLHYPKN